MTEYEWLAGGDPIDMLLVPPGDAVGDRKVRLLLVACCRRVWGAMSDRNRAAVEVAERFADGLASQQEREATERDSALYRDVGDEAVEPEHQPQSYWCDVAAWKANEQDAQLGVGDVCDATRRVAEDEGEEVAQARLLRCIAGNPFRPVAIRDGWRSPEAVALAGRVYDSRDFSRLHELAAALSRAGCGDEEVLSHCRTGEHARGCWVVDGVLGRR